MPAQNIARMVSLLKVATAYHVKLHSVKRIFLFQQVRVRSFSRVTTMHIEISGK